MIETIQEVLESEIEVPSLTDRAVALFIDQFRQKDVIVEFAKIIINELEELLPVFSGIKDARNIDKAGGWLLDICGAMVGETRQGREDVYYRDAIKLRILMNGSCGEPERLITAIRFFYNPTKIKYSELWPAKVLLQCTSTISPPNGLLEKLQMLAMAGVKVMLQWDTGAPYFGFSAEGGIQLDKDIRGFGETGAGNENVGGKFSERIS